MRDAAAILVAAVTLPSLAAGQSTPSCGDLAGRTDLLPTGNWCYQLDSSHPDVLAAVGGSCTDYYVSSTNTPNGVKLCYLDGDTCKSSEMIVCASPPGPPGLASPSMPPLFTSVIAGRTNLLSLPETVWCYHLDDTNPTFVSTYGTCESFYFTDVKFPGAVNLCVMHSDGKCKSSTAWVYTSMAPPGPPPPGEGGDMPSGSAVSGTGATVLSPFRRGSLAFAERRSGSGACVMAPRGGAPSGAMWIAVAWVVA